MGFGLGVFGFFVIRSQALEKKPALSFTMPEDIEYAPDCENVEDSKLKLPEKAIAAVETKTGEEEEDVVFHE